MMNSIPMFRRPLSSSWSLSTISNIFSSETAWSIRAIFHLQPPWVGGAKVCINGPDHMMAAMPIYGKTFKTILLQNLKSYDPETWHAVSGTQPLQSLYKW